MLFESQKWNHLSCSPVISRKITSARVMQITITAVCAKIKPNAKLLSTGRSVGCYLVSLYICPLRTTAEVIFLESDYTLPCY